MTSNYLETIGVRPILGRLFLPEEEETADVALVSEPFWRKRLGSDPQVVGRSITLNGVPTTIVGVMPKPAVAWWGPDTEIFTTKPFQSDGVTRERLMRGMSFMRVAARLKPGVTIEQARAAMPTLFNSYREQWPDNADNSWSPKLVTATENALGELRDRICRLARGGRGGAADRLQQRGQSIARAFHRTTAGDRVAHGLGRVASRSRQAVCLREHTR